MKDNSIDQDLFELLGRVDTPTVCNAIEVAQKKRGFAKFTRRTLISAMPEAPAIVGFAKTAKIAGLHPPKEDADTIKQRRVGYFEYMADGDYPRVAVVEDTDFPDCVGAWWGEVHTYVHKGLGISGALTNGAMRDLGDMAAGFPVIAGSIGPSHGFVHVKGLACDVDIMGLRVSDGDLVHADRHGALVIPEEVIPDLEIAIETLFASEKIILEPAKQDDFSIEKLKEAWKAFEAART